MAEARKFRPPLLARHIIKRLDQYEERFSLQGDLLEEFDSLCRSKGTVHASQWYWRQALKCLPQYFFYNLRGQSGMLKNYLKSAWRHITGQKGYAFINMAGLAVGVACTLLITLWVIDERSYDNFHENGARIYRLVRHVQAPNMENTYVIMPNPLGPAIKENFAEVKNTTRYSRVNWPVRTQGKMFSNVDMVLADSTFFKMFTFRVSAGQLNGVLNDPKSIVITASMARKCFGETDAMGQTIEALGQEYTVAAVLRDPPHQSHIQFECVMPIKYHRETYLNNWQYAWQYVTYVEFYNDHCPPDFAKQIESLIAKHRNPENQIRTRIVLQPLKDIHLHSDFRESVTNHRKGNHTYLMLFSLTGLCILVIACFNFINLSTARSGRRIKEIGLRKVIGANRTDIIRQFLGETMLYAICGLILAIFFILIALPQFNVLTGKVLSARQLFTPIMILAMAAVTLLTGLLAGSYPALILSASLPVKMLSGSKSNSANHGRSFRNVLVMIQFALTILLMTASLVIYAQLKYISSKDLGFDKSHIITFHAGSLRQNYEAFKSEALMHPQVSNVSLSVAPNEIGAAYGESNDFSYPGQPAGDSVTLLQCAVDYDFLETFKIELIQGRWYNPALATDSSNFLLNESAVKALGFENPIGQPFRFQHLTGRIIGVIKDFHIASLHAPIKPALFWPTGGWNLHIKIQGPHLEEPLNHIRTVWEKHRLPGLFDLDYEFLDETIEGLYSAEYKMGQIFKIFTILAVIISSLGLLGLASFMAEQRVKEIGIRKTLGASTGSLISLLLGHYFKWVMAANLVAIPAAWFFMRQWLNGFAFHTRLNPAYFLFTLLMALIIVMLSAGYQTVKAALTNPVKCLKYE